MLTSSLSTVLVVVAGLFAQPEQPPGEGGGGAGGELIQMFILLGLVMLIFYFILFRGQRKKQKQRKDMLAALKKGDRVMTIGGIIGTALAVKDTEVVVKVDEGANVKMTFVRTAIDRVVTERQEG